MKAKLINLEISTDGPMGFSHEFTYKIKELAIPDLRLNINSEYSFTSSKEDFDIRIEKSEIIKEFDLDEKTSEDLIEFVKVLEAKKELNSKYVKKFGLGDSHEDN